jgi:5'-methylthioadenosine phosphorylase
VRERAEIGVIGGSGFYEFLDSADEVRVETPYGPPSDPLVIGEIGGKRVAFLPRHGRDHRFPPHKIPYRANMWALRSVGVRQIIAPSAVGSLTADYGPGTLVVIEGPRFSTRAESRWYAAQDWTLIGMTGHPEAVLARELALCYTTVTLVTDTDAGVEEGEGVTQEEVFRVFAVNIAKLREVIIRIIEDLPMDRNCPCPHALDGLKLPFALP